VVDHIMLRTILLFWTLPL